MQEISIKKYKLWRMAVFLVIFQIFFGISTTWLFKYLGSKIVASIVGFVFIFVVGNYVYGYMIVKKCRQVLNTEFVENISFKAALLYIILYGSIYIYNLFGMQFSIEMISFLIPISVGLFIGCIVIYLLNSTFIKRGAEKKAKRLKISLKERER